MYFGALHHRLSHLYDCGCDVCNYETKRVELGIDPRFKKLLNSVTSAFKKLHSNKGYTPEDLSETKEFRQVVSDTNRFLSGSLRDNDLSEGMLQSLKDDIFIFSGLKTHAQLAEASRQLLTSDGKIKSRAAFLNDVTGVSESHQRYLEAEYDFAVGSVLMADRWDNFNDSDRYLLQYRTAGDDRVRDTHDALNEITLPKSDPFWDQYFPPNGWRCRCTTVQVLGYLNETSDSNKSIKAGEKATTQESKNGKNKLEIFRFNPGRSQVAFPPDHPYKRIQGAGKAAKATLSIAKEKNRYAGSNFTKVSGVKKSGVLEIFKQGKQSKVEFAKNKKALTIAANSGEQYRMLPVIQDGRKNPDAMNLKTGDFVDVKVTTSTNGKNIVQNSLKEASRQGSSEIVLHITNTPTSYRDMYIALKTTLKSKRNKNINKALIIFPDGKITKYDIGKLRVKITKG